MTSDDQGGLRHLSVEECWQRLRGTNLGRLAVINGNQPDIFPVNYVVDGTVVDGTVVDGTVVDGNVVDGEKIVVRTAEGTKLAAAIATGTVAFEIDAIDPETESGWSVVVHGVAREPRSVEAVLHDHSLELEPWARAGSKLRFIEITPTRTSGRAAGGRVQDS